MEKECDPVNKKSNLTDENGNLLLTHQTGACSVFYAHSGKDTDPIIVCPYRFFERENGEIKAFKFIQNNFFPKKTLRFFHEIGLGKYGRADWMICEITENCSEIIDFFHLEIQADATTGTRGLVQCVKDFFDGKDISNTRYGYGLNSKASIKGSSLQMIDKGFMFEKLGKKSFWVLQDTLFETLCDIFSVKMKELKNPTLENTDTLIFITPTLNFNSNDQYKLDFSKCYTISPTQLQKSMADKSVDSEEFKEALYEKVHEKFLDNNYFTITD